jgi:hypothetical protein
MSESEGILETPNARRVRTAALMLSALFVPIFIVGSRLSWTSTVVSFAFLLAVYASALTALFTTLVLCRNERHGPLARWRRTLYVTGVELLLALCLLPLATWPVALSGVALHLRSAVFCLVGVNVVAAIFVWFGRGWSRLGLTVVAYWICFLWLFPLALRE